MQRPLAEPGVARPIHHGPDFQRLLDALPGGAYMCDAEGLITYFNHHAARMWGREPKLNDPCDRFCGSFKLYWADGTPLEHSECWMALALRNDRGYNGQEISVERPDGERLTVLAHANPIHDDAGRLVGAVNVLIDITAQKRAATAIRRLNVSLEEQVAQRTAALGILHEVAIAANEARSVDAAIRVALRRICSFNDWALGHAWLRCDDNGDAFVSSGLWNVDPQDDDVSPPLREFQRITEATTISIDGQFVGRVARTGEPFWYDDTSRFADWRRGDPRRFGLTTAIAFPVRVNGDVVAVLDFFSVGPIRREQQFMEVMADVGIQLGHVFERKRLERAIADATAEQQQRIAHQLHDSVSQSLTGAAMMGESLRQALACESSPHAMLATKLVNCLNESQHQVRQVSRGLVPVELDAAGLMTALEQMARRCPEMYKVPCYVECDEPILVEDNAVATQLYYIACEALHNSVKHSGARAIVVRLERSGQSLRMTVEDDGHGMDGRGRSSGGMGMPIMHHRAGIIGAKLDVASVVGRGTKIVCTAPLT